LFSITTCSVFASLINTEETVPKNITSSIKDEKFLNFFFSRIRWTKPEEAEFLKDAGFRKHYPFVSLCGREVNFIRPACSPIVYHSIVNSGSDLMYGGNLIQPFQYSNLAISKESGKIYHKLPKLLRETSPTESNRPRTLEYGLLRSSIVISLSERILPTMSENDGRWNIVDSDGTACPIDWLPEGDEPGDWAMQYESTI
jgi:hypothetical protein